MLHKAVNYARMGQLALHGGRPEELDAGLAARIQSEMPPQGDAALRQDDEVNRRRQEELRRQ